MKVLLVGGGGREDALAWALARSPGLGLLRCAPGNAGIGRHAERVPLRADDVDGLTAHAVSERYDLVVIGPEAPLVLGLADRLRHAGIDAFGPGREGAVLEGSKVFSKQFMQRHGIPTAAFRVFDDSGEAARHLLGEEASYPLVVKADGLAAGKGVFLAEEPEAAVEAAEGMLSGRAFGEAGARIVVEERLWGREVSVFVLTDGERMVELAPCQDYKRARDGDRGPNTGGLGAYSPSAWLDPATRRAVREQIAQPTVRGLAAEGRPYRGVLFLGIMLTDRGPRLLEYNVRFGDPETQALVPRLDGHWLPLLHACARGDLGGVEPRWRSEASVCVVLASEGYPGTFPTGIAIEGLEEIHADEGKGEVLAFHAGTERQGDRIVTAGGRVLGITALGPDLAAARARAYAAAERVRWRGRHLRTDIALDALG
jgi:phosphoribosylamine--glycine ligase